MRKWCFAKKHYFYLLILKKSTKIGKFIWQGVFTHFNTFGKFLWQDLARRFLTTNKAICKLRI
nr:MAG TPA: hypothetical protein [Caudoviricetes sp.]